MASEAEKGTGWALHSTSSHNYMRALLSSGSELPLFGADELSAAALYLVPPLEDSPRQWSMLQPLSLLLPLPSTQLDILPKKDRALGRFCSQSPSSSSSLGRLQNCFSLSQPLLGGWSCSSSRSSSSRPSCYAKSFQGTLTSAISSSREKW
jgi:hypothetical protein